jgi:hypothetical protein
MVLHLVQVLVDRLDLELSLLVRLLRRGVVDSLCDDVLQVRINGALVHGHQLFVEHVFTLAEYLLGLTTT